MSSPLPLLLVEAPAVTPYRYGLASVAQGAPVSDAHWRMGVEYEQIGTYAANVWPGACYEGATPDLDLPAGAPTVQGLPFSVYAGVDCKPIGYTEEYILARARAILALGWQHAAEQALWTGAAGSAPALISTTETIDTGLSVVAGIAALEKYLTDNYSGVGVIHAARDFAAYAQQQRQIVERVGSLQTVLGTGFCFGGGYPNTAPGGDAAEDGTMWLYATGMLTVRRDEAFISGGLGAALSRLTNDAMVYAEQPTVLTVDGPIAAVSIDLTQVGSTP